jgi:indolepyruvate ferredoxin oxidoreductase
LTIDKVTAALTPENHAFAVALLSVPEQIRGYGHVKVEHIEKAKAEEQRLLSAFADPNAANLAQAAE